MATRTTSVWTIPSIGALVLAALATLTVRHSRAHERLAASYRAEEHARTLDRAAALEASLATADSALRAVAELPGARAAAATGAPLGDADRAVARQLFELMAERAGAAELFLVSADGARSTLAGAPPADAAWTVGGAVAVALRPSALQGRLAGDLYALYDTATGEYLAEAGRDARAFEALIRAGQPDPGVLYSEVIPIEAGGERWALWVRRPDSAFWGGEAIRAEDRAYFTTVLILSLGMFAAVWWHQSVERALRTADQHESALRSALEEKSQEVARRAAAEQDLGAALVEAKAAAKTKSQFLANMSHELRTPLNAIIGYTELTLEGPVADDTEAAADLGRVLTAARHLLSLINDVLDLSKIEAGRMVLAKDRLDLRRLIDDTVTTAAPLLAANHNEFSVELGPGLGAFEGDALRIKQILLNLLSNAAKFTHRGTVRLRVERREPPDPMVVFTVEDTGIGMTEAQVGRLFQPFVQGDASTSRRFGGTGLGLALSARFAELMGGTIDAASTIGQGSRFTFSLRLDPLALARERTARGLEEARLTERPIVLCVDSDLVALSETERALSRAGMHPVPLQDPTQAVEVAGQLAPSVILVDFDAPGLSGFDLLAELEAHEATRHIPRMTLSKPIVREALLAGLATLVATEPRAGSGSG